MVGEPISLEIDEEHAAAIGRVAAAWASFELAVNMHICILANFPVEEGMCVIAQIFSTPSRIRALLSLVHLSGGSKTLLKKLTNFEQRTHALAEKRNRIIHDPWMIGTETRKHYRLEITAMRTFVFAHKIEDKPYLDKVAQEIKTHQDNLFALWQDIIHDDGVREALRERYQTRSEQQ
jgi:hypothetical protein